MKFRTQLHVLGMKASKGTLDNGQVYDSTKIYCQIDLDDSKGNAKGFGVAEYGIGTSDSYNEYKHLPFPFIADAELEIVTNGRVQKTQVLSLKPIDIVKSKPTPEKVA